MSQKDWLMNSGWEAEKQNIIFIHGYAGGEETPSVGVIRDGKLRKNVCYVNYI